MGLRGGAVACSTAPQAGRSRVRFPMVSLEFFIDIQYCHGKSCVQQEEDSLYQQIGLKLEEETSKMLHLEHGFVWC